MLVSTKKSILGFFERLTFLFWIVFTIFSYSLFGFSLEIIVHTGVTRPYFILHDYYMPCALVVLGFTCTALSIIWRLMGVRHLHYLELDTPAPSEDPEEVATNILQDLIREVDECRVEDRAHVRAKVRDWLLAHVSELDEEDIMLARNHFNYLLPEEWGYAASSHGEHPRLF